MWRNKGGYFSLVMKRMTTHNTQKACYITNAFIQTGLIGDVGLKEMSGLLLTKNLAKVMKLIQNCILHNQQHVYDVLYNVQFISSSVIC